MTEPGQIGWSSGDQIPINFLDKQFRMGDFRVFIHDLVGAAGLILKNDLLLSICGEEEEISFNVCGGRMNASEPNIQWATMRDDATQGRPRAGWSFLKDFRSHEVSYVCRPCRYETTDLFYRARQGIPTTEI